MPGPSTTIDDVTRRPAPRRAPASPAPQTDAELLAAVDHGLILTRATLDEHLSRAAQRARHAGPHVVELWSDLRDQTGGKLVRPRLTLAAYLSLGGHDLDAVVPVAAAHELLHTAMLVHDDLLDHDESRRGRPNLAGTTRARLARAGVHGARADAHVQAAALLGGDLALSGAFDLVMASTADPAARIEVAKQLVHAVQASVAGEVLDVAAPLRSPLDGDPRLVAELKTATYTCIVPLASGAILAGADAPTRAALDACGRALGIAFQLVDDLLGVFGDPQVTGKSAVSDLREGKRTLLLAAAYQHATPADVALLDQHVGRADLTEAGADVVREVMRRTAAPDAVREAVAQHLDEAREVTADLPGPLARHLLGLAEAFAGRVA